MMRAPAVATASPSHSPPSGTPTAIGNRLSTISSERLSSHWPSFEYWNICRDDDTCSASFRGLADLALERGDAADAERVAIRRRGNKYDAQGGASLAWSIGSHEDWRRCCAVRGVR